MTKLHGVSFNAGVTKSQGCDFTFTRAIESYDALGVAVASGQPRYWKSRRLFSPRQSWTEVATSGSRTLLATGVDSDGTTPITVIKANSAESVEIVVGSVTNPTTRTISTGTGFDFSDPTGATNSYTPPSSGAGAGLDRHIPVAATVFYGLIVVLCEVQENTTGSTYSPSGFSAFFSTDQGASWAIVFDDRVDLGSARELGKSRGNWWAVTSPTPDTVNGKTTCYVSCVDYIQSGTTGRAIAARFTRDDEADTSWALGGYDLVQDASDVTHFHSMVSLPDSGLGTSGDVTGAMQFFIMTGDTAGTPGVTPGKQSVRRATMDSGYTLSTMTGAFTVSEVSGDTANNVPSVQPTSGTPSHNLQTFFVGSDVEFPAIMECGVDSTRLVVKGHGTDFPTMDWDEPAAGAAVTGYDTFRVQCTKPGNSGLIYAKTNVTTGADSNLETGRYHRLFVSSDGVSWGLAASASAGDMVVTNDGYIVYDKRADESSAGWSYCPLPASTTARPLNVRKGGTQMLYSSITPTLTTTGGGSLSKITDWAAQQAAWTGPFTMPNLPSEGLTIRVTAPLSNQSSIVAEVGPPSYVPNASENYRVRMWFLNRGGTLVGHGWQDRTPGATLTNFIVQARQYSAFDWTPIEFEGTIGAGTPTDTLLAHIRGIHNLTGDPASFYLHIDYVEVGAGGESQCAYPIAPTDSTTTGRTGPNETATVTLPIVSDTWTVVLPIELTTHSIAVNHKDEAEWVIATIYRDASNFIKVIADPANQQIDIEATVAGNTNTRIATSAQLNADIPYWIALSADGTTLSVAITDGIDNTTTGSQTTVNGSAAATAIGACGTVYLCGDENNANQTDCNFYGVLYDTQARSTTDLTALLKDDIASNLERLGAGPRSRNYRDRGFFLGR